MIAPYALRTLLLDFADGRVFTPIMPPAEASLMPRPAIALRMSPSAVGLGARDYLPVSTERVDVFCYGATLNQAEELRRAVRAYLLSIRCESVEGTTVYPLRLDGSAPVTVEPETQWPVAWTSYLVIVSEATGAPA